MRVTPRMQSTMSTPPRSDVRLRHGGDIGVSPTQSGRRIVRGRGGGGGVGGMPEEGHLTSETKAEWTQKSPRQANGGDINANITLEVGTTVHVDPAFSGLPPHSSRSHIHDSSLRMLDDIGTTTTGALIGRKRSKGSFDETQVNLSGLTSPHQEEGQYSGERNQLETMRNGSPSATVRSSPVLFAGSGRARESLPSPDDGSVASVVFGGRAGYGEGGLDGVDNSRLSAAGGTSGEKENKSITKQTAPRSSGFSVERTRTLGGPHPLLPGVRRDVRWRQGVGGGIGGLAVGPASASHSMTAEADELFKGALREGSRRIDTSYDISRRIAEVLSQAAETGDTQGNTVEMGGGRGVRKEEAHNSDVFGGSGWATSRSVSLHDIPRYSVGFGASPQRHHASTPSPSPQPKGASPFLSPSSSYIHNNNNTSPSSALPSYYERKRELEERLRNAYANNDVVPHHNRSGSSSPQGTAGVYDHHHGAAYSPHSSASPRKSSPRKSSRKEKEEKEQLKEELIGRSQQVILEEMLGDGRPPFDPSGGLNEIKAKEAERLAKSRQRKIELQKQWLAAFYKDMEEHKKAQQINTSTSTRHTSAKTISVKNKVSGALEGGKQYQQHRKEDAGNNKKTSSSAPQKDSNSAHNRSTSSAEFAVAGVSSNSSASKTTAASAAASASSRQTAPILAQMLRRAHEQQIGVITDAESLGRESLTYSEENARQVVLMSEKLVRPALSISHQATSSFQTQKGAPLPPAESDALPNKNRDVRAPSPLHQAPPKPLPLLAVTGRVNNGHDEERGDDGRGLLESSQPPTAKASPNNNSYRRTKEEGELVPVGATSSAGDNRDRGHIRGISPSPSPPNNNKNNHDANNDNNNNDTPNNSGPRDDTTRSESNGPLSATTRAEVSLCTAEAEGEDFKPLTPSPSPAPTHRAQLPRRVTEEKGEETHEGGARRQHSSSSQSRHISPPPHSSSSTPSSTSSSSSPALGELTLTSSRPLKVKSVVLDTDLMLLGNQKKRQEDEEGITEERKRRDEVEENLKGKEQQEKEEEEEEKEEEEEEEKEEEKQVGSSVKEDRESSSIIPKSSPLLLPLTSDLPRRLLEQTSVRSVGAEKTSSLSRTPHNSVTPRNTNDDGPKTASSQQDTNTNNNNYYSRNAVPSVVAEEEPPAVTGFSTGVSSGSSVTSATAPTYSSSLRTARPYDERANVNEKSNEGEKKAQQQLERLVADRLAARVAAAAAKLRSSPTAAVEEDEKERRGGHVDSTREAVTAADRSAAVAVTGSSSGGGSGISLSTSSLLEKEGRKHTYHIHSDGLPNKDDSDRGVLLLRSNSTNNTMRSQLLYAQLLKEKQLERLMRGTTSSMAASLTASKQRDHIAEQQRERSHSQEMDFKIGSSGDNKYMRGTRGQRTLSKERGRRRNSGGGDGADDFWLSADATAQPKIRDTSFSSSSSSSCFDSSDEGFDDDDDDDVDEVSSNHSLLHFRAERRAARRRENKAYQRYLERFGGGSGQEGNGHDEGKKGNSTNSKSVHQKAAESDHTKSTSRRSAQGPEKHVATPPPPPPHFMHPLKSKLVQEEEKSKRLRRDALTAAVFGGAENDHDGENHRSKSNSWSGIIGASMNNNNNTHSSLSARRRRRHMSAPPTHHYGNDRHTQGSDAAQLRSASASSRFGRSELRASRMLPSSSTPPPVRGGVRAEVGVGIGVDALARLYTSSSTMSSSAPSSYAKDFTRRVELAIKSEIENAHQSPFKADRAATYLGAAAAPSSAVSAPAAALSSILSLGKPPLNRSKSSSGGNNGIIRPQKSRTNNTNTPAHDGNKKYMYSSLETRGSGSGHHNNNNQNSRFGIGLLGTARPLYDYDYDKLLGRSKRQEGREHRENGVGDGDGDDGDEADESFREEKEGEEAIGTEERKDEGGEENWKKESKKLAAASSVGVFRPRFGDDIVVVVPTTTTPTVKTTAKTQQRKQSPPNVVTSLPTTTKKRAIVKEAVASAADGDRGGGNFDVVQFTDVKGNSRHANKKASLINSTSAAASTRGHSVSTHDDVSHGRRKSRGDDRKKSSSLSSFAPRGDGCDDPLADLPPLPKDYFDKLREERKQRATALVLNTKRSHTNKDNFYGGDINYADLELEIGLRRGDSTGISLTSMTAATPEISERARRGATSNTFLPTKKKLPMNSDIALPSGSTHARLELPLSVESLPSPSLVVPL